jgi:hypothetical protein
VQPITLQAPELNHGSNVFNQEADYERTFVLEKSPLKRTLVGSAAAVMSGSHSQPLQLQQFQQFQQQQPSQHPSQQLAGTSGGEPIILMRTKGNPNVLVQVTIASALL